MTRAAPRTDDEQSSTAALHRGQPIDHGSDRRAIEAAENLDSLSYKFVNEMIHRVP
jgi:hypothetical protein